MFKLLIDARPTRTTPINKDVGVATLISVFKGSSESVVEVHKTKCSQLSIYCTLITPKFGKASAELCINIVLFQIPPKMVSFCFCSNNDMLTANLKAVLSSDDNKCSFLSGV